MFIHHFAPNNNVLWIAIGFRCGRFNAGRIHRSGHTGLNTREHASTADFPSEGVCRTIDGVHNVARHRCILFLTNGGLGCEFNVGVGQDVNDACKGGFTSGDDAFKFVVQALGDRRVVDGGSNSKVKQSSGVSISEPPTDGVKS